MYTVYSKENCSQCDQAVLILDLKGLTYQVKKLGVEFTREDLFEISPKARSYPVILKDGELLGTLLDLKSHLRVVKG